MVTTNTITRLGFGSCALAAVLMSFGGAVASADITMISPTPEVTIDTPVKEGDNAVRAAPYEEVQAQGVVRDCDVDTVCAQGTVSDTTEAIVGSSKGTPYDLARDGEWDYDPPMGDWTPLVP